MDAEIGLIKKIYFCKVYYVRNEKKLNYCKNSLYSTHSKIEEILTLLNQNHTSLFELLLQLHCQYLGLISDFYSIRKIIFYGLRKNYILTQEIDVLFDENGSVIHIIRHTVNTIMHLKNTFFVKKYPDAEIEKAYKVVHSFTSHGHYLSKLSSRRHKHTVKNILLYLRHIEKTITLVYTHSILSLLRSSSIETLESK